MAWFESRSGCRMWYEDTGSGTPLILIHGWCMASPVWKYQQEQLSDIFRVITVDLRGHGHSALPEDGFTISGCSMDVNELLEVLNINCAVLVGWSLGAFVAIETFLLNQCRFSGLVLVGATPCFVRTDEFPHGLSIMEVTGMMKKVERNIDRALAGFKPLMFTAAESLSSDCKLVLDSVPVPSTEAAQQSLMALTEADMRWQLPLLDCPTLVMHGDSDRICLPQASEYISEHVTGAELILFPECGHAPFITHYDSFNTHLRLFQRRISCDPVQ